MFGFKKSPKPLPGDDPNGQAPDSAQRYIAVENTQLPLSPDMIRMMAQELPIMDSVSRARVYEILHEHAQNTDTVICSIEELPNEIRDIMDLY